MVNLYTATQINTMIGYLLSTQPIEVEGWNQMTRTDLCDIAKMLPHLDIYPSDTKEDIINLLTHRIYVSKIFGLQAELKRLKAQKGWNESMTTDLSQYHLDIDKINAEADRANLPVKKHREVAEIKKAQKAVKEVKAQKAKTEKTSRQPKSQAMPEGYSMGEFNETKKQYPLLLNGVQIGKRGWWVGNEEQAIYWANYHLKQESKKTVAA